MENQHCRQQAAYDKAWSYDIQRGKVQHGNIAVNLAFIEKTGLAIGDHDILEIGCGNGFLAAELARRGGRVVATDISSQAIAFGRSQNPDLNLRVMPAESLDFPDEAFDRVLSFDLLEHLHEVDKHLLEVHRILRPGGFYLIGTPNKWLDVIYETISHRGFKWTWAHPSLHSYLQLRRRLARHGFSCRFIKMNTITDFILAKLPRFLRPGARLFNTSYFPQGLQTNLYVVAKKGEYSIKEPRGLCS